MKKFLLLAMALVILGCGAHTLKYHQWMPVEQIKSQPQSQQPTQHQHLKK